eukprot:Pgem_evm1s20247
MNYFPKKGGKSKLKVEKSKKEEKQPEQDNGYAGGMGFTVRRRPKSPSPSGKVPAQSRRSLTLETDPKESKPKKYSWNVNNPIEKTQSSPIVNSQATSQEYSGGGLFGSGQQPSLSQRNSYSQSYSPNRLIIGSQNPVTAQHSHMSVHGPSSSSYMSVPTVSSHGVIPLKSQTSTPNFKTDLTNKFEDVFNDECNESHHTQTV